MPLRITVPDTEYYDEEKNLFQSIKGRTLYLEHSLLSISKWESIWHKPFLSRESKTNDETISYIRCMQMTNDVDPNLFYCIPADEMKRINDYIADPMTGTTFANRPQKGSREIITSELIYYWMIELGIPFECQKWHLNRLLTLIRVCSIKNTPGKKMGRNEIMQRNAALNAQRRAKLHSHG